MEFSKKDRLFLYNQYEILKLLKHDDEYEVKQCNYFQEILLHGYKHNYHEMVEWVEDDTPDTVSKFVWDVLQMYSVLINSYNALSADKREGINEHDITYGGFDGNEEGSYYCYSRFILEKMERYSEIYKGGNAIFNSHWPILNKYRGMLTAWENLRKSDYDLLTREQMLKVIGK